MGLDAAAIFWGLCALLTLGVALATHRRTGWHQTVMALCMVAIWIGSKIVRFYGGTSAMLEAYPVEDTLVGMIALSLWVHRPESWKIMLAFVLLVRIAVINIANHRLAGAPQPVAATYSYILTCNLLFGAALLCIVRQAGVGWGMAFADRLLPPPWRRPHRLPARAQEASTRKRG